MAFIQRFVYFTPLVGGWLADNFLGQRKAVIMGALIMATGQFILAASASRKTSTCFTSVWPFWSSATACSRPNISTMAGELYPAGDARRDSAFSIFYMGVNLGAFLAPLICSTLGESADYGWIWGYFAAGCGMTCCRQLIQVLLSQRFLGDVGKQPSAQRSKALAGGVKKPLTPEERDRLKVIFMLFVFVVLFWAAFEQAGGLMNLYASEKTDRMLGGFEVPAGWFQSVNSLFIILLAPLFGMLWVRLAKHGDGMPTPIKMMAGLLLTGVGFVFMVGAVFDQQAHGKANMIWLIMAYLFHTMGELCISPVGLSMVTKLAPLRLASLMMGVWFLINSVANYLAGKIGVFAEQAGELTVFAGLAGALALFGLVLWFLSGKLVDWMHGAEADHIRCAAAVASRAERRRISKDTHARAKWRPRGRHFFCPCRFRPIRDSQPAKTVNSAKG